MLMLMRKRDERHAGVIRDSRILQFYEWRHFRIGNVQRFELLDYTGIHARLIERTVVRQRMLFASTRDEDTQTGKQNPKTHETIVGRFSFKRRNVCFGRYRTNGQVC